MFKMSERLNWNYKIVRAHTGFQNTEIVRFVGYLSKTMCVVARESLFSMEDRVIVNIKELHKL